MRSLQGNHLPSSYYLMKQIMEVRDISSMEWHSCEAGCTGWAPTPKEQWHEHKDDVCPKCNGKRFKKELGKDVPVRVSSGCDTVCWFRESHNCRLLTAPFSRCGANVHVKLLLWTVLPKHQPASGMMNWY